MGLFDDMFADKSSSAIEAAIAKANQKGAKELSSHERSLLEDAARQAGEIGRQASNALKK